LPGKLINEKETTDFTNFADDFTENDLSESVSSAKHTSCTIVCGYIFVVTTLKFRYNKIGEKAVKKIFLFFTIIFSISLLFCGVVEKLANKKPMIKSVTAFPSQIGTQDTTTLKVVAEDPDGDMLSYRWDDRSKGEFVSFTEDEVKWIAPSSSGRFRIEVKVTDENGGKTTGEVFVDVIGDESPIVTLTEPIENQIITGIGYTKISANVEFQRAINRVDFSLDNDSLLFSDSVVPYEYTGWNVTSLSGEKLITARAYDSVDLNNFGEDSVHVFIEGVVPVPE